MHGLTVPYARRLALDPASHGLSAWQSGELLRNVVIVRPQEFTRMLLLEKSGSFGKVRTRVGG